MIRLQLKYFNGENKMTTAGIGGRTSVHDRGRLKKK